MSLLAASSSSCFDVRPQQLQDRFDPACSLAKPMASSLSGVTSPSSLQESSNDSLDETTFQVLPSSVPLDSSSLLPSPTEFHTVSSETCANENKDLILPTPHLSVSSCRDPQQPIIDIPASNRVASSTEPEASNAAVPAPCLHDPNHSSEPPTLLPSAEQAFSGEAVAVADIGKASDDLNQSQKGEGSLFPRNELHLNRESPRETPLTIPLPKTQMCSAQELPVCFTPQEIATSMEPSELLGKESSAPRSSRVQTAAGHEEADTSTDESPEHEDKTEDGVTVVKYWHETEQRDCSLTLIHPVALYQPPPHFDLAKSNVIEDFKGKRLYLFLDYDGTLTPIVKNPWKAHLSPLMRQLLYSLAAETKDLATVGIVTGRALTSVKNFVQIIASKDLNFIYAASHGFHIEAAGKMLHHRVGSKFIPVLKKAAGELEVALSHIEGVALEDNEFAVSVHYRNAAETAESVVEGIINSTLESYPELKITRGKKVFELRINVSWNKGRAVFWLLNAMRVDPFDTKTRVIYVGDDLTDEDAFKAIRTLNNSLSVLVSDVPDSRPTAAQCYVKDPDEVATLLRLLLAIAKGEDAYLESH